MRKILCFVIFFSLVSSQLYGFNRNQIHNLRLSPIDSNNRITNSNQKQLISSKTLNADDIYISESITPAKFKQDFSDIIGINDNLNLVVFADERMGSSKIFGQYIDKVGNHVGSNFLIAGSSIGNDYVDPKVELDLNNKILLFYRDRSSGLIYGSRYNSDWSVDLSDFLVNDSSSGAFAGPFDFALYDDGKFEIVWENYSNGDNNILLSIYDENGLSLISSVIVNSNIATVSRWVPTTAVDPNGNILVAWEDYRNGRADIYIRLFNGAGVPLGNDLALVPSPHNSANQYAPEVTLATDHKFIIGWIDRRIGQEVYGQLYSVTSGLIGSNQIISDPDPLAVNWNLDMASDNLNSIAAVYAAFGPQNSVSLQRVDSLFNKIGSLVTINQSSIGGRWEPAVLFQSGYNAVCWTEHLGIHSDISLNYFNTNFSASITEEKIINDDNLGAPSNNPAIAASSDWYKLIAFEDSRFDQGDIFVQAVSNAGIKATANHKVNQDPGQNKQAEPDIAASVVLNKGLVVWVDSRDVDAVPGQRIYGRFCNELGWITDNEFMISDVSYTEVKNSPKTAIASNGEALVAWLDNRFSKPEIIAQRVSSDGVLLGSQFLVSDSLLSTTIGELRVTVDSSDNYYIFYSELNAVDPKIKMKKYNSSGSLLFAFEWVSPTAGITIDQFDADVLGNGEFAVTFSNLEPPSELYLAHFSSSGTLISTIQKISDGLNSNVTDPSISISNNNYLSLCWVDRRNGKQQVMYQIIDDNFTKIGVNQIVTAADPEFMITPVTNAVFGRAFFSWVDPRENGNNIYGSIIVYLPTDIEDGGEPIIPKQYNLYQNYPNPFNPNTSILFSLPEKAAVKLAVYNMLGQEVTTLIEQELSAGNHLVDWDGTNRAGQKVASGLYFYKLLSENYTGMKKMLLLK